MLVGSACAGVGPTSAWLQLLPKGRTSPMSVNMTVEGVWHGLGTRQLPTQSAWVSGSTCHRKSCYITTGGSLEASSGGEQCPRGLQGGRVTTFRQVGSRSPGREQVGRLAHSANFSSFLYHLSQLTCLRDLGEAASPGSQALSLLHPLMTG